jgi:hypothetical protein
MAGEGERDALACGVAAGRFGPVLLDEQPASATTAIPAKAAALARTRIPVNLPLADEMNSRADDNAVGSRRRWRKSQQCRVNSGDYAVMHVEDEISRSYDVGALGSSEAAVPFYCARGQQAWQSTGDLICEWRPGDVW